MILHGTLLSLQFEALAEALEDLRDPLAGSFRRSWSPGDFGEGSEDELARGSVDIGCIENQLE